MMTKASIKALMKGLEKKADSDLVKVLGNIDEAVSGTSEQDEESARIRLPYVNATPIGTGTWK